MSNESSKSNGSIALRRTPTALAPVDRHPRRQVVRHMRHLAEIAEVTKAGMTELGDVSSYATYEAGRTLATMNLWEQASQLSPEQKQKVTNLKNTVLDNYERLNDIAAEKIIALIQNMPPEAASSFLDELSDLWDR